MQIRPIVLLLAIFILPFQGAIAQSAISMPKNEWLKNLEQIFPQHLCAKQSPFLSVYSGDDCLKDAHELYTMCTDIVNIPNIIVEVHQANALSSKIGECISAHYMGGEALKAFELFQAIENRKP